MSEALLQVAAEPVVVADGEADVVLPALIVDAAAAGQLLDRIRPTTLAGLRDRALLSVMLYSFARVSAVLGMRWGDYYRQGSRGGSGSTRRGGGDRTSRPTTERPRPSTPTSRRRAR